VVAITAAARAGDTNNLVENSPFLPPNWREPEVTPTVQPRPATPKESLSERFELVGVTVVGEITEVILFDSRDRKSFILEANESVPNEPVLIAAITVDAPQPSVTLRSGQRSEIIWLKGSRAGNVTASRSPSSSVAPGSAQASRTASLPQRRALSTVGNQARRSSASNTQPASNSSAETKQRIGLVRSSPHYDTRVTVSRGLSQVNRSDSGIHSQNETDGNDSPEQQPRAKREVVSTRFYQRSPEDRD